MGDDKISFINHEISGNHLSGVPAILTPASVQDLQTQRNTCPKPATLIDRKGKLNRLKTHPPGRESNNQIPQKNTGTLLLLEKCLAFYSIDYCTSPIPPSRETQLGAPTMTLAPLSASIRMLCKPVALGLSSK